jgi:hypothetical protein
MKRLFFIAATFIFILFVACKNEANKSDETIAPVLNPEAQSAPAASNPLITPGSDTLQKASGNLALNPQHGQPGHRCDIAVGAPLNSPAGNNAVQQPAITTSIPPANTPPISVTPQASGTASGNLNPQHGQPGHRCDIAVGAPLNSKPNN